MRALGPALSEPVRQMSLNDPRPCLRLDRASAVEVGYPAGLSPKTV
jgi:hypothetical protein